MIWYSLYLARRTFSSPPHSQVVDINGYVNSLGTTNLCINDKATSYLHAWMGGEIISGATGVAPTYRPRLAIAYYFLGGDVLNNKFPVDGVVGFQFVNSGGQTNFGYVDLQVNRQNVVVNGVTNPVISSVTINDVYYNKTPNAGIAVPISVVVTNISVGPGNVVTIGFTANTNAPATAFTLQTSPALGASANWTTDPNAVINNTVQANPNNAKLLAGYQAVTITNGGPSQFYRLSY